MLTQTTQRFGPATCRTWRTSAAKRADWSGLSLVPSSTTSAPGRDDRASMIATPAALGRDFSASVVIDQPGSSWRRGGSLPWASESPTWNTDGAAAAGWTAAKKVAAMTAATRPTRGTVDTVPMSLRPQLHEGEYVFTTVAEGVPLGVAPVVTVVEPEGLTLVLTREDAEHAGLAYDYVAGWITLLVATTLDQIGITASSSAKLAEAGISCNVVAGYHHDHLFVPHDRADEAVALLA